MAATPYCFAGNGCIPQDTIILQSGHAECSLFSPFCGKDNANEGRDKP